MKKFIFTLVAIMLCTFGVVSADEADIPIKLIVDNRVVATETVTVNDRVMVPLRTIMEGMNAEVVWYGDTSEIDIKIGDETIRMKIGSNTMKISSVGDIEIDVAPILYNGETTYVPTRAICEASGSFVEWDEGTKTVLITSPDRLSYVDFYDGKTLEMHLADVDLTPEQFENATGIDYETYKDAPYALVDNLVPLKKAAEINEMSIDEAKAYFELENADGETTWGEILGEITLRKYLEAFTEAGQYGIKAENVIDGFREYYNLGEEYSLDTKFKFIRVIVDSADLEAKLASESAAKAEQEKKEADAKALAGLCENKIFFTITLEDGSQMKGELYPDVAPTTVANFVKLCDEGFYDGLIFHRVIDDFVIQGGGYDKDMEKKYADPIIGEFYANGVTNALKHERGVISMARTSEYNSASSEFFIMDEAESGLDGYYASFGRITEGFEVLDRIAQAPTETVGMYQNVPTNAVVIKSITIER